MKERWKPIDGYESLYEVSNFGRVRSYHASDKSRGAKVYYLKPANMRGYLQVNLCKEGSRHNALVHWLVAAAFLGEKPSPEHEINHVDFDKTNNHEGNLEWMLHPDNNRHSKDVIPRLRGEANRSKLTEAKVRDIRARYAVGNVTLKSLGLEFGVSENTIWHIVKRKKWAHVK